MAWGVGGFQGSGGHSAGLCDSGAEEEEVREANAYLEEANEEREATRGKGGATGKRVSGRGKEREAKTCLREAVLLL